MFNEWTGTPYNAVQFPTDIVLKAIGQCKRRLDAAVYLFGDGRIDRDEYLRRVEQNEREIAHWESRTTETEKAALELTMCVEAISKLARLWEMGEPEDRQGMARTLFSYITYDIDTRRIVDFRLKPWADRFLILRADMYSDDNQGFDPQNKIAPASEGMERAVPLRGLQPISCSTPRVASYRVCLRVYHWSSPSKAPLSNGTPHNVTRNTTIRNRYLAGEGASDLAREYHISPQRVSQIVRGK